MKWLFIYTLLPFHLLGQVNTKSENILNFPSLLINNLYLNYPDIDTVCFSTVVFVKFNITNKGKIIAVSVNKETPAFLKKALFTSIEKLDYSWYDKSNLKKDDLYLLPVLFLIEAGCGPSEGEVSTDLSKKSKSRYLEEKTFNVFRNMIQFNDHHSSLLKCVLLNPVYKIVRYDHARQER
ncbi:MAG: hypothetical protein WBP45_13945 [Daejeonella sp.]